MKTCLRLALLVAWALCVPAEVAQHIFVATDESRKQLLYVNEVDPSQDWTIAIGPNRDLQLINDNRQVLISVPTGYRIYGIADGSLIKEVTVGDGIASVRRDQRGHTYLASRTTIWELDPADQVISEQSFELGRFFRLLRFADNGNYLYTSGKTTISEATRSGEVARTFDLAIIAPDTAKPYFAQQLANGNYLISTGYGACLVELTPAGELVRTIGGRGGHPDIAFNFFGDAQVLANGHV
ncbi:MAG: hypothetical protein ACYTF0_03620, partial [Planctomycetota bacterium]